MSLSEPLISVDPGSLGEAIPPPDPYGESDRVWPALSDYEIVEELGRGAMGVVYKARQIGLNRLVALKMILGAYRDGASGRRLLQAEAEAVARLSHPHIVQIHEIGEHDGAPFFSLEFCPGGSLTDKLAGKPLPGRECAELVRTLAAAVEAAHAKGIIHRDLKPGNVLIAEGGVLKVTDFGLAKRLDEAGEDWVGVMGTPGYMAPEQAEGRKDIGPPADVYSLGAILYECLTGRPPFLAAALEDMLEQIRTRDPVAPRELQPRIAPDLETICLKCLEKSASRRYGSAKELADDLGRFLRGEPIKARPVSFVERTLKWARRQPTAAMLVAALAQAAVGVALSGWFFGMYKEKQAETERKRTEARRTAEHSFSDAGAREFDGWRALEGKQEEEAARQFAAAERLLVGARTALEAEKIDDEDLRRRIDARLERLTRWREMRPRVARLEQDLHDILFHEISPLEQDREANRREVLRLARAAMGAGLVKIDLGKGETAGLGREEGQFASAQERKRVAEQCYQVLLAWAEAVGEEGKRKTENGKSEEALRLLDVAAALARAEELPTPQAYHLRRARYLEQLDRETEAVAEQRLAAETAPNTALDWFLISLEYYQQNKLEEAADACGRALQHQPNHFWAQYLLALCQVKTRRFRQAETSLTACLALRGDFFLARLLLGTVRAELGQFKLAEADFESVLKQTNPFVRYQALTNRSILWAAQKMWDKSLADLDEARKLRPRDYQAHLNLAYVRRLRKDLKGAVEALNRAIECRPDDATLYYTRARDHLALKNMAAARDDLTRAIDHLPRDTSAERLASAYVELGVLKDRAGERALALEDFAAALAVLPKYPPAYRQQAETLLKLRRYPEAGKALDLWLRYGKPAARDHLVRGLIHSQLRQYLEATESFNRALLLDRDNPEAMTQRGWAYLQLDSPRVALLDFERSLTKRPNHPATLCGRGRAKVALGRVEEGLADGEEALRLGPSGEQDVPVACLCALAATVTRLTRPAGKGDRLQERCLERAADLVCRAVLRNKEQDRADFWRKHIEPEPALAAVRRHPKVVRLLAAIKEK